MSINAPSTLILWDLYVYYISKLIHSIMIYNILCYIWSPKVLYIFKFSGQFPKNPRPFFSNQKPRVIKKGSYGMSLPNYLFRQIRGTFWTAGFSQPQNMVVSGVDFPEAVELLERGQFNTEGPSVFSDAKMISGTFRCPFGPWTDPWDDCILT